MSMNAEMVPSGEEGVEDLDKVEALSKEDYGVKALED